jgi:trehalose 6-phosphate synthase/phosphatase
VEHARLGKDYLTAERRLLLLDYDGTLVDFAARPDQVHPSPDLLALIQHLASEPGNTVVIVSGRDRGTLEAAFAWVPVALAAEHGCFLKEFSQDWETAGDIRQEWKPPIRDIMQAHAVTLPGAFVEEKTASLVWHYRQAPAQAARKAAHRLAAHLSGAARAANLQVMHGHKIVEVRVPDIDKGQAARHWLARGPWDFVLAAGDDTTDEDMFAALPPEAHSIKVGRGHTMARHRLQNPAALQQLLTRYLVPKEEPAI